jgi:hypothetical protein
MFKTGRTSSKCCAAAWSPAGNCERPSKPSCRRSTAILHSQSRASDARSRRSSARPNEMTRGSIASQRQFANVPASSLRRPAMRAGLCLAAFLCLFATQLWCQWSCAGDDAATATAPSTVCLNHAPARHARVVPPDDCPGATIPVFAAAAAPRLALPLTTTSTPEASYVPARHSWPVGSPFAADTGPPLRVALTVLRI